MLRSLTLTIALASVAAPQTAHGRLFWQTYGATVAADGGCGCAWNVNQDYFVPRHCHTGRYGLFSACKSAHSISPACKNMHPVYADYCTPYGPCRYKWRDHVYATYCGCGPLKHHYGAWHLEPCGKHPLVRKHGEHRQACGPAAAHTFDPGVHSALAASQWPCLCNVESFGGEVLGSISALSVGPTTAAGPSAVQAQNGQPLPPQLNLSPSTAPTGGLPAPFNF
jgi:hypothetical protein